METTLCPEPVEPFDEPFGTKSTSGHKAPSTQCKLPKEKPRNPKLNFWVNLITTACFLLALLGCVRAAGSLSRKYPVTNECDITGSQSQVEKQFQINIVAISGLRFTRAKILDLVWDIGVAHGGRFLHGLILYHVACNALTWSLERSSLPYPFLVNLLLWPDSILSLCCSCSYFAGGKGRPRFLLAVVLAYLIAHVLFFSALWSAATGYQSPGTVAYAMPDGSWVAKDNDTLRMCWTLDSYRLGHLDLTDNVILGPKIGDFFGSFADLDVVIARGSLWNLYPAHARDVSEDFHDMYSYARSKQTVKNFLQSPGRHYSAASPGVDVVAWNVTARNKSGVGLDEFSATGFINIGYNSQDSQIFRPGWKPPIVKGWQFLGTHQNISTPLDQMVWIKNSPNELLKLENSGEISEFSTETDMTPFIASLFYLNASIPESGQDLVPYNSTLWFNGTKTSLEAPFLEFKKCAWLNPVLGECLCYKGKPLMEDFRDNTRKLCISSDGYTWGFSKALVFVGLLLEVIWCYICSMLYLLATQRSELIRRGRPTKGTMRTILDLSDTLNRSLPEASYWYTEKQLMKEIEGCEPVGYAIWDEGNSVANVGLVPFSGSVLRKRKLRAEGHMS